MNGSTIYKIAKGDFGKQVNDAYRTTVAHLASGGLNVIVDDVCDGNNELQIWREILKGYDCIFIGVFCNGEELERREQNRGNRKLGIAIEQSLRVHQGIKYDLAIDTGLHSSKQCVEIIKQKLNEI